MSNEIVKKTDNFDLVNNFAELQNMCEIFFKAGIASDVNSIGQIIVKVMAGREIGIGAIAAIKGVYLIKTKNSTQITYSANVTASKIKSSGKYNYQILQCDDTTCEIQFLELFGARWEKVGTSKFTVDEAQKRDLQSDVWKKTPSDMLFARALTRGARRFCPDALNAVPAYSPDDFADSAVIDTPGNSTVIDIPAGLSDFATKPIEPPIEKITIESLMKTYGAEKLVKVSNGALPQTEADLKALAEKLQNEAGVQ